MSCTYCRARHYRCDEREPQCRRCERAGRRCVREPPRRFRHFNAPKETQHAQVWLPLPPKVDFVDESGDVFDAADDADSSQDDSGPSTSAPPRQPSTPLSAPAAAPPTEAQHASNLDVSFSPPEDVPGFEQDHHHPSLASSMSCPQDNVTCHQDLSEPVVSSPTYAALRELGRAHHMIAEPTFSHSASPNLPWMGNQWPLPTEEEAMLLRFYTEHVSTFFDLTDPYRWFRFEVPQRARTNKPLANAILALSARMYHWKTGYNLYVADRYYQRCLETLIPALNDEAAVMDETILAATVILRMLEEMDVHISGSDREGHLTGSQAIISAASATFCDAPPAGIRRAAYWCAYRQELWMGLQRQKPAKMSMSAASCGLDVDHGYITPTDDWGWCQRAIAHIADSLDCMLESGRGKDEVVTRWKKLLEDNEKWWSNIPPRFEPFFGTFDFVDQAGQFPDIRLLEDCHGCSSDGLLVHDTRTSYLDCP